MSERTVAVVTGAGQGLGRAFALRLAADGLDVAVADVDEGSAGRVAEECRRVGRAMSVGVDVADEDSVSGMAEAVLHQYGSIGVLVNNAAVFSTLEMRPFDEIPIPEWDQVMAVNVRGAFLCARAAAPVMRRAGWGRVINISSAAILIGRPQYLHYVTSKSALIGFTRALASELGPHGVTVNAITPGSMETEIPRKTVTGEQANRIVETQAVKRRGVADDLLGLVSYLSSSESGFMTGQTINIDGGAAYH